MNYRSSFFLILLAVSLLAPQFVDAQEPGKVVVATIDKGMAVLQDPALNAAEKFAERREKLWGVLRPVIQFDEMSKRALGPKWQELSVEQRAEFVDIFTFILKDAYLGKSDAYSGQKIIYLREKQEGKRCRVQTTFVTSAGQEIAVDFSLIENKGEWKVYDLVIEGVSLISNYRSQFNSILLKSSYEDLIKKMKEKKITITES